MGRPKGSKNKPKGNLNPTLAKKKAKKVGHVGVEVKAFRVKYNIGEDTYPYEVQITGVGTDIEATAGVVRFSPSAKVFEVIEVTE
ncbi:MAG: hypothetical protein EBU90_23055 [Proteobacteria bacterium]|nr:hypothetical protein [Pseudomonadota bacterium]